MAAEGLASLSATALLLFDGIALVIAVQTGCGLLVLAASLLLREPPGRQASLTSVAAEWASMRSVLLSYGSSRSLCGVCWVLCVSGHW